MHKHIQYAKLSISAWSPVSLLSLLNFTLFLGTEASPKDTMSLDGDPIIMPASFEIYSTLEVFGFGIKLYYLYEKERA